MKDLQKIILVSISIILILGAIIILLINPTDFFNVFLLYFIVIIPSIFIYLAFQKNKPSPVYRIYPPVTEKPLQAGQPNNRVLYVVSTFWPLVFFTDSLIIREKTITIVDRLFFISVWSDTLPIESLTGVTVGTDIFFASLTIIRKDPSTTYQLIFLKKNEAIKAKELIDGLMLERDKIITIPPDQPIEEKIKILQNVGRENILNEDIKKF